MNESSPFTPNGQARRLIVTIVIGTAAAITAGLALSERPQSEAVAESAATRTAVSDALAPTPLHTRRVPWRDPWKHPASDPSLPAAAKALEGAPNPSSGERAPTF